jgi:hypothetical protein
MIGIAAGLSTLFVVGLHATAEKPGSADQIRQLGALAPK